MKTINGRKYNTKKFTSIDAANQFMSLNRQWATIDVVERDTIYINRQITVWVAKTSDLGKPSKL